MEHRVAVAIVNYNGGAHVRECLESLRRQTFRGFRVSIFDNGSTDGSPELIDGEFPEFELMRSRENIGFAAGSNRAIGRALIHGSVEYVFTLNNDVVLEEGCLGELVRTMDALPAEVWSAQPKIYLGSGPSDGEIINNAGILVWRDGSAFNRGVNQVDRGQFDRSTDIFGTCAAASIYRRVALEKVGLFDERFFAYLEDVDLAWRGRRAGYRSVLCPGALCRHRHGASAVDPAEKIAMLERNRVFVLLKNYPAREVALSPLYTLYRFALLGLAALGREGMRGPRYCAYRADMGLTDLVRAVLRGLGRGLNGAARCLGERKEIIGRAAVSDRDVRSLIRAHSGPLKGLLGS